MSDATATVAGPLRKLASVSLAISGCALVSMVIAEMWQVVARYVFNDSPSWTEPVVLLLLNIAMMFSAAVAVRNNAHFAFRVLVDRAAPGVQRIMKIFAQVMTLLVGATLSWYGTVMALDAWPVKLAGAEMRQGVLFVPLAFGGALIVLFAFERIILDLSAAQSTHPSGENA